MKINLNMSAVMTNKQLLRTENRLQASMERLSSGLKINKASDNPAGMAISNKMKAQIDALNQATSNASDGVSVMEIADGALNEVSSILQRIRELSVQAANDTNTYADKQSIQAEIDQLKKEVDRISTDTEYNTKTLLDGSSDTRIYPREDGVDASGNPTKVTSSMISRIDISDHVPAGKYEINVTSGTQAQGSFDLPSVANGRVTSEGVITINGISMNVSSDMTMDEYLQELQNVAEQAGATVEVNASSVTLTSKKYGEDAFLSIKFGDSITELANGPYTPDAEGNLAYTYYGTEATVTLGDPFSNNATVTTDGNRVYVKDNGGLTFDFLVSSNAVTAVDVEIDVTEIGNMTIQIGANQYQSMDVRIPEVSSESLYLDYVDVTVAGGADDAIDILDAAIEKVSSIRSRIGAFQNRLEYANNSLQETEEDMTGAYSRILDTDMAKEMTEYTQQNILDQAGISVLSQANDIPQQVLSLLQ